MSNKGFSFSGSENVVRLTLETFRPEDEILAEIRKRSEKAGLPAIQVGDMDGRHLEVFSRMLAPRRVVEIGTLGGYSGVCLARGLSAGGKLFTFEYSPKHAEVARESFRKAGFAEQVEVLVGSALENLGKVESQGPFDLVFIDADKAGYPQYLDWATQNLRIGGVVIGDNTFAWGRLADTEFDDAGDRASITALRSFNEKIAQSGRFSATMIPTGEGLTVGVKLR